MEKFKSETKNFLLSIDVREINDDYWIKVVEGIELLFNNKHYFKNEKEYLDNYLEIRNEVLNTTNNRYVEELSDELWSILIHSYPMPNFWTSTITDFKNHVNFKKYFQMLDDNRSHA